MDIVRNKWLRLWISLFEFSKICYFVHLLLFFNLLHVHVYRKIPWTIVVSKKSNALTVLEWSLWLKLQFGTTFWLKHMREVLFLKCDIILYKDKNKIVSKKFIYIGIIFFVVIFHFRRLQIEVFSMYNEISYRY